METMIFVHYSVTVAELNEPVYMHQENLSFSVMIVEYFL